MKKWNKKCRIITGIFAVLFLVLGNSMKAEAANTYQNGEKIEFSSEEKIDRMYILWDTIPGEWKLEVDGQEFIYGQNDFSHEYVEPGVSGYNWTITIEKDNTIVGDVYTFTEGEELPEWVQKWNLPCEDADLMLLSTHADDELLYFGGTLPFYAGELGYDVQVVYLTNHWEREPHRIHELLNGLWTCGIDEYPIIGPFEDKYSRDNLEEAKGMYDLEAIQAFQSQMLRRFKPEVLLMQDINGEYGHSVHMLNTAMMMESIELAAQEDYLPEDVKVYGVWDTPKWYIHFYDQNVIEMDWNIPLEKFQGKTAFEVANEAYQCHETQVRYNRMVQEKSAIGCVLFGLYRSTVGEDVLKNDFFENITYPQEIEVAEEVAEEEIADEENMIEENTEEISQSEDVLTEETVEEKNTREEETSLILNRIVTVVIVGLLLMLFWGIMKKKQK